LEFHLEILSTNDIVSAIVWKILVKSRYDDQKIQKTDITKCGIILDFAPKFPSLSQNYIGNSTTHVIASSTVQEVLENDLSYTTFQIRNALQNYYPNIEDIVKFINSKDNKKKDPSTNPIFNLEISLNILESDICTTSSTKFPCFEIDFGGKPIFQGRGLIPIPGIGTILATSDGGIEIFFALPFKYEALFHSKNISDIIDSFVF